MDKQARRREAVSTSEHAVVGALLYSAGRTTCACTAESLRQEWKRRSRRAPDALTWDSAVARLVRAGVLLRWDGESWDGDGADTYTLNPEVEVVSNVL